MAIEKKGQTVTPFRPRLFFYLFFSYPFVGRYAFVERLFMIYFTIYQDVICSVQQFYVFVAVCKSARIRYDKLHKRHLLF